MPLAQLKKVILTNRVDRKSTRLNSSHLGISYAVFCLKKKKKIDRAYPGITRPDLAHLATHAPLYTLTAPQHERCNADFKPSHHHVPLAQRRYSNSTA